MLWIIFAILGYFLLAVSGIIDKILLSGPIPKPKIYAFYIGALSLIVSTFLLPFGIQIPDWPTLLLAFLSGALWIPAAIGLFEGLSKYEASRIIPAVGGMGPCFVYSLNWIFSKFSHQELPSLSSLKILAFLLLLVGSVVISYERRKSITKESLKIAIISSFLFAISFTSLKYVFLTQPFISGFVWTRVGTLLAVMILFFSKDVKEELFKKIRHKIGAQKPLFKKPKTMFLFLTNQALGGLGGVFQTLAVYFSPSAYLPFVNALEGTKYVFLFLFSLLLSVKFPQVLSEKMERKIIIQKLFAILLIGGGLLLLFQ